MAQGPNGVFIFCKLLEISFEKNNANANLLLSLLQKHLERASRYRSPATPVPGKLCLLREDAECIFQDMARVTWACVLTVSKPSMGDLVQQEVVTLATENRNNVLY